MLQLIIVMETRSSNKSDYMYIKSTIDYYYKPRTFGITKLYAETKSKLITQDAKIESIKAKTDRNVIVILCADYDREEELNKIIVTYCNANHYELVWMNPNIEEVYWGKHVDDKDKEREAIKFQQKKNKLLPTLTNISSQEPLNKKKTSNILIILDKYLQRDST